LDLVEKVRNGGRVICASWVGQPTKLRSRRRFFAVHHWTGFALHRWTGLPQTPQNRPITLTPIRDGKLVPLGVTTARRSTLLPEVPTITEAGVAGFDFPIWYGIWAPAGTPTGVVDKLAKDVARALAGQDLRDWVAKHGGEPMSMTQPQFARFVQSESEGAARLSKAAGIEP
jgi:hypothetical protein